MTYEMIETWVFKGGGTKYISDDYKKESVFLEDLEELERKEGEKASIMVNNYGRDKLVSKVTSEQIEPNNTKFKKEIVGKINSSDAEDKLKAIKEELIDPDRDNYEQDTIKSIDEVYNAKINVLEQKEQLTILEQANKAFDRGRPEDIFTIYEVVENKETKAETEALYYNAIRQENIRLRGDLEGLRNLRDSIKGPDSNKLKSDVQEDIDRLQR
jgi:hypothetical protein